MDAGTFLDIIREDKKGSGFRLAEITEIVASPYPGAKVLFDGETLPASKAYPTLTMAGLEVGARVLLVPMSTSMIIVGALGAPFTPEPGLIVTHYEAIATASLSVTTTEADVAGTTITVTTTTPNAHCTAWMTIFANTGATAGAANSNLVARLNVDGVNQSEEARLSLELVPVRITFSQVYDFVLATAGTHTIKIRGLRSGTGGSPAISSGNLTKLIVKTYETP